MKPILVLLCASGCSFGTTGPSPRDVGHPVECTSDFTLPIADTFLAVAPVAGIAIGASASGMSSERTFGVEFALSAVATYAAAAVWGYTTVAACRRALRDQDRAYEQQQDRERSRNETREHAWSLTKAAAAAARTGDCAAVLELDAQVRAVDLDFHNTVFLGDVAIARCLAQHAEHEDR
jgi:hypothetical protein